MNGTLVIYESTSNGAFGKLTFGDLTLDAVTPPWMNNEPGKSCVPPGIYTLEPHNSPKHPNTWAMVNHALGVSHEPRPDVLRSECLIHPANWAHELEGCIAPGLSREGNMVTNSQAAMEKLRGVLTTSNTLTIMFGEAP